MFGEPSIICPTPPQCVSVSPRRWAGLLLMNTVPDPFAAVHMLGPQQAAWTPLSPTRSAGLLFTLTLGDPCTAGPTHGCGQAGQPWASAGTCDLSPMRLCGGPGM